MTSVQKLAGLLVLALSLNSAAAKQARDETDKRLALEQKLAGQDQQHTKELSDEQLKQARLRDRLATSDLRLSVSSRIQPVASTCLPPAPSAWFMPPVEPNLTQRMLKELSLSPTTATKD